MVSTGGRSTEANKGVQARGVLKEDSGGAAGAPMSDQCQGGHSQGPSEFGGEIAKLHPVSGENLSMVDDACHWQVSPSHHVGHTPEAGG